ncbi:MAG: S9 family peptidase [Alphaproteobacteria bacterium]|nr:S9 family peptidase [Alphaproteobacteria bacterium]
MTRLFGALILLAVSGGSMSESALAQGTGASALPPAPKAAVRPHTTTRHGVTLVDDYFWLKDQSYPTIDDPEVLDYLKAENAYFEAAMAPHKALTDTLFEELKGRLKEDDASVPVKDGDFLYWWAFDKGAQYRKWYRKPVAGGPDQLLIDENVEAKDKKYFRLGTMSVSPDGKLAAWSADTDGSERFTIKVRDLATGKDIATVTDKAIGSIEWASDNKRLLWTEVSEQWRPYRVRVHTLGAKGKDPTIYEEKDTGFFLGIGTTQDRSHFIIATGTNVTSEVRLLPKSDPMAKPILVAPRKTGLQYDVDMREGTLYIRANDTHRNFRVATASLAKPGEWRELIPGSDRHYIRGITAFRDVLAITERLDGLDQVRLRSYDGGEHYVAFPEASYTASLGSNPEYAPQTLRIGYASMVTPSTTYDYDLAKRELVVRKVQEVPSGYDRSQYVTERLTVTARDGAKVPVSIVYKKGFPKDGTGRVHLYAYGAYGIAVPPGFSTARLSLLDRGFAFAIAHIRGGDDLGYQWYLDGKLDKRTNTFNDFVDVANGLVAAGFAKRGNISASGGSAGGSLMGAVLNQDPQLWRAVVAHVPFVDILNTMQDESLPLTPTEWPEWGNPITDKAVFDYILSYSPYENVAAKAYPPILVTAGLNDPRVTYWEPAKWVARLRAKKTDDNLLLLKTNMGAGHGGKSGRFESLRETAEEYTFILKAFGLAGK